MENTKKQASGSVRVSEDVIIKISKTAACEIEGVSFCRDGSKRSASGSVKTRMSGESAAIKLVIFVDEGYNAAKVAEDVQHSVKSAVQNMTGFTVTKVDVTIAGVCFKDGGKKPETLPEREEKTL